MKEILLTSSVLILALLALRQVFRNTISRRMQYALWGLVLLRLLLPFQLPAMEHSVLSATAPVQQTISANLETQAIYIPVDRSHQRPSGSSGSGPFPGHAAPGPERLGSGNR